MARHWIVGQLVVFWRNCFCVSLCFLVNLKRNKLDLITRLCGSFTSESWPGCKNLERFSKFTLSLDRRRQLRDRLMPVSRQNILSSLKILRFFVISFIDAESINTNIIFNTCINIETTIDFSY